MAGCIKVPLGMEVGLSPGDFVLHGEPASPPMKGHSPQFLSNVRCGQTTGWMKTPLGREIDLGPGHIVLDRVPALHERGTAAPPSFWPMSIVATVAHLRYCWALVNNVLCPCVGQLNLSPVLRTGHILGIVIMIVIRLTTYVKFDGCCGNVQEVSEKILSEPTDRCWLQVRPTSVFRRLAVLAVLRRLLPIKSLWTILHWLYGVLVSRPPIIICLT